MDAGDFSRFQFQRILIQNRLVFVGKRYILRFGSCKCVVTAGCRISRNFLHQRRFLEKGKHTLAACQRLIQVIRQAGQRHDRAEGTHHRDCAGQDSLKSDPAFRVKIDRQCQHAERCQKNHHVGDRPLGAFHAA